MKYIKNRRKINFTLIFSIVVTIIYFLSSTFLYRGQANLDRVDTDLPAHIKAGLSGNNLYSLMYAILGFLWKLPYHSVLIGLTLSVLSMLSIYFTYVLLKKNLPNISNEYLYLAALVCNMYMPIHMPYFNDSPYLGLFCFNLFHNSTYIAMRPFALLSIIIFIKLFDKYYTKPISFAEWFCFSFSLFITTWFKPNFMFGFAPCMLIFMLIDFAKGKSKNVLNYIIFGTTVFPSVLLMLWQQAQLFDQTSGIGFEFLKVWKAYSKNPFMALILSLAFPLIVLFLNYKDLKKDKVYRFGWILAIINISIFAFLYEKGSRMFDGNLSWGTQFAVGVLFILSMYKFLSKIKIMSTIKLIAISAILGMHILCGINYIVRYSCTGIFL